MKNIEKHLEELKANDKNISTTCAVFKFRTGGDSCADHYKCRDCNIENLEWLNSEYVEPIKLTRFEYDLLKSVSGNGGCIFSNVYYLTRMQSKGYFQNVDITMTINGILNDCEVTKNGN